MFKPTRRPVTVQVPGLPGQGYVWRRRTVLVNQVEFNQIRKWRKLGFKSKSAMVLTKYLHRVNSKTTK